MGDEMKAYGADVKIGGLIPLHDRKVNFRISTGYRKILASIREVGLIEPLCVHKEDGSYVILDGFLRYKACQELGAETVPCLVFPKKEAYTFNRMVNRLSHMQEARMLRKSLETIDEKTIARVFGLKSIRQRLDTSLLKRLHPEVVNALDRGLMGASCAGEFVYVKPERQAQILEEMKRSVDYSTSFARALVLRTPENLRSQQKRRRSPWDKEPAQKQELVAKLEAIEKRYDFYSGLYRQYTTDLLRLCIFVRKLVTNDKVQTYLQEKDSETLSRFQSILFETEGAKS